MILGCCWFYVYGIHESGRAKLYRSFSASFHNSVFAATGDISCTLKSELPMLNRSSLPVVEPKRLPPMFYLSVGALLGLLIVTFVLGARGHQKQASLLNEYGTALAQISAQEVVEESISSDLVSMHAIMQRVVAQPRVLRAAVHDVDQQLLVQAGQSALYGYESEQYSAPIPLRDSAAGTVTVTVNVGFPGESAVRWTLSGTAVLLMIMAGLAIYESRGVGWYFSPAGTKGEDEVDQEDQVLIEELMQEAEQYFADSGETAVAEQEQALDSEGSDVASEATGAKVTPEAEVRHYDLILALPNRGRLEQLLNSERFLRLTSQFEQAVEDVLALYGGTRVGMNPEANIVCARFTSEHCMGEAAFRATCSAHLIAELTGKSKMHLQLVAEVRHPLSDAKLAINDAGVFVQASLVDSFFAARVDTVEVDEQRHRLAGFKGSYRALLERQQAQLADA